MTEMEEFDINADLLHLHSVQKVGVSATKHAVSHSLTRLLGGFNFITRYL